MSNEKLIELAAVKLCEMHGFDALDTKSQLSSVRIESVLNSDIYKAIAHAQEQLVPTLEKLMAEYDAMPDDGSWENDHPILLMAEEIDRLRNQASQLAQVKDWIHKNQRDNTYVLSGELLGFIDDLSDEEVTR